MSIKFINTGLSIPHAENIFSVFLVLFFSPVNPKKNPEAWMINDKRGLIHSMATASGSEKRLRKAAGFWVILFSVFVIF